MGGNKISALTSTEAAWTKMNVFIIFLFRMNIYSDPVVQLHDPVVVCTVCGEHGHTRRGCHYTKAEDLANMSHEDGVFWTFVHPGDRPEALGESDEEEEEVLGNSDSEESEVENSDSDSEEESERESETDSSGLDFL